MKAKNIMISLIFLLLFNTTNAQVTDVINTGLNSVQDLFFVGNELYIADFGLNKIMKADISLSNPTPTEVVSISNPRTVFVDFNNLYVSGNGIYSQI